MKNKYFVCLFFLLLNLLIYGYIFSANSYLAQDLPFIHKLLDPALYPGDLYVNTLNSFPSLFIHMLAGLAGIVPIPALFFAVYLLAKYLFFLAGYQITHLLFRDKTTSALSVLLLATAPLINTVELFGGQPVMHNFLYHGNFAVPFGLMGLYLFLRRKYTFSLLVLSGLFYFNALIAAHLTIMLLFATLALLKEGEAKSVLIKSWGIFAALFMIFFIKYFPASAEAEHSKTFIAFLRSWHPQHYFLTSWSFFKWIRGLSFLALFLFVIFKGLTKSNNAVIKYIIYSIFAMWAFAALSGEVFPFRLPVILQFFRSDIFFVFFGIIYAAFYLKEILFSGKIIPFFAGLLIIVFLTDLHLYFQPYLVMTVAAVLIIFFAVHHRKNAQTQTPSDKPLIIFLIVLVALLPYLNIISYHLRHQTISYNDPFKTSWHDVQTWAKNNTSKDERFLTPPYLIGFRVFSQRGTFVERLDGGAAHWSPGIEQEWEKRLDKLGYGKHPVLEYNLLDPSSPLTQRSRMIYAALDESAITTLSEEYGINYVVEENFRQLALPLMYKNDYFSVYETPRH